MHEPTTLSTNENTADALGRILIQVDVNAIAVAQVSAPGFGIRLVVRGAVAVDAALESTSPGAVLAI